MSLPPSAAPRRIRPSFAAFTLVELLVSMTVLAVLVLTVISMINSATRVITFGSNTMDSDSRARVILDRIGEDISRMVKRTDVAYQFNSNTTGSTDGPNDSFTFYSEISGYPDPIHPASSSATGRTVALVSYHIGNSKQIGYHQLSRASRVMQWGDLAFKTAVKTNQQPDPALSADTNMPTLDDSEFQVLGDTVFRLEFAFLLKDTNGVLPRPTATLYVPSASNLQRDLIKISDVSAIVVAIAVLDDKNFALVQPTQANPLDAMISVLPDYVQQNVTDGKDILGIWGPIANREAARAANADFRTVSGLPLPAAGAVRVYQRYFYLQ